MSDFTPAEEWFADRGWSPFEFQREAWAAYLLGSELFVKRYSAAPGAYPDFGCSFETFTNADFLELETLGPLVRLAPGEFVYHTETWTLARGAWTADEVRELLR